MKVAFLYFFGSAGSANAVLGPELDDTHNGMYRDVCFDFKKRSGFLLDEAE